MSKQDTAKVSLQELKQVRDALEIQADNRQLDIGGLLATSHLSGIINRAEEKSQKVRDKKR